MIWMFAAAVAILMRAPGLGRPLLGNFSGYQTGQAMMAANFIETKFSSVLYPQLDVLVNGKPGLVLLYYPVSSLVSALLKTSFGGSLDFWGRFQALVFFVLACAAVLKLLDEFYEKEISLAGTAAFILAPLTIIYGQSFQNEMATVFFSAAYYLGLVRGLKTHRVFFFYAAGLMLSGVLLTRPNLLYLLVPAAYLVLKLHRPQGKSPWAHLTAGHILGAVPPAAWFVHVWNISQSSNHIFSTLFAQVESRQSFLSEIILTIDYYQSLFDILAGVVLTPLGLSFFFTGIYFALTRPKAHGFFLLWLVSFACAAALTPRKYVDHDFYLLHFLLPALPFVALGALVPAKLLKSMNVAARPYYLFIIALGFAVSMRYALHPAFKSLEGEEHLLDMADRIESTTDPDSFIIVQGTYSLLYYANRKGWTFSMGTNMADSPYFAYTYERSLPAEQYARRYEAFQNPVSALEYMREFENASYFAAPDPETLLQSRGFFEYMKSHYRLICGGSETGFLFDLTQPLAGTAS